MEAFCLKSIAQLEIPIENDPLAECGAELTACIKTAPEKALKVADEKLHVFPFKDVEACWRRLYADAGICKALQLCLDNVRIRSNGDATNRENRGTEEEGHHWLDQVVRQLDMVLIMTGAPLREEVVEGIFRRLQELIEDRQEVPPFKRRKTEDGDAFDTSKFRAPDIQFPVPRSEMPLSQFEKLLEAPKPRVMEDALQHWPAFDERSWRSPSYLMRRTLGGRRLVPVELGRSYTDDGWGQTILTFREFLNRYVLNSEKADIGYLAQHNLFSQIPALRNDIAIPDFCYTTPPSPEEGTPLHGKATKKLEEPLLNAWFGPAGTISPLHTDPYHNILCQVVGKKYVRLYAPSQTENLYPRGTEEGGIDMSNTSQLPVEKVEMNLETDDDEFPLFDGTPYVETILQEGDCLYIPVGWWHYIRALTVSFNVSFWWN